MTRPAWSTTVKSLMVVGLRAHTTATFGADGRYPTWFTRTNTLSLAFANEADSVSASSAGTRACQFTPRSYALSAATSSLPVILW
jgi:hypothetical protein